MILSILAMGALYNWFPSFQDAEGAVVLDRSDPVVLSLIVGSVLLTVVSIFNYKKRQQQFVLNRLSIIFNFGLLGVFVYRSLSLPGETLLSMKGVGVLLPAISIVFLALANRAIKRDEDLVKSVDRLR